MPSLDAPLSPERWDRVLTLFHAALDRPPDARTAFLHRACEGDADLLSHVTRLLDADAADASLLDTGNGLNVAEWVDAASMTGAEIGPYRIQDEIGRGGMGVVYRAARSDVDTVVALKVLRDRFPSPAHLQRFLRERRVVGRLNHPNIARFLDAGVTSEGLPFFAMEYVEGRPITEAAKGLGLSARLDLFEQVCNAVQAAHRRLVVHRDLKPSNVLVTEEGQVKLLDFGIAKLLDTGNTLTRTDEHLLTPAYAAPEQVSGDAVTTAVDVYALGVLLYELLTGRLPVDVRGVALPVAAQRILHHTPDRPSEAAARAETAPVAPGRLRGDLDALCCTALAKDPDDRYPSVQAFLDDVRRHREDRPIEAQTLRWTHRTRKFVQRNRAPLAAVAAVIVLVGALVAAYTVQLQTERDRAQAEARTTERVTDFLVEALGDGNPNTEGGAVKTVEDVLRRAADRADALRMSDPLIFARIATALGDVYEVRNDFDASDSLFQAALAAQQAAAPDRPDLRAASLANLGSTRTLDGDYPGADSLLTDALSLAQAVHGEASTDVAEVKALLAKLRTRQGRYAEAGSLYTEAVAVQEAQLPETDPIRADTYQELGTVRYHQGDYSAAADLFERAAQMLRMRYPNGHTGTAAALTNAASIHRVNGRYAAAESLYIEALAMTERIVGTRHLETTSVLNNLGALYYRMGRMKDAAEMWQRTLALRVDLFGEEDPRVATVHNNLSVALRAQGNLEAAQAHLETALSIRTATLGIDHPQTLTSRINLAVLHEDRGRFAEAEAMYRELLPLYRSTLGEDHPRVGLVLSNLGSTLSEQSRYDEARSVLEDALAHRERVRGEQHPDVAETLVQIGTVHRKQGEAAAAETAYRRALSIRQAALPDHWETALTRVYLGRALHAQQRYAEGEPHLVAGYAALARHSDADSAATRRGLEYLNDLYTKWDRASRRGAVMDSLAAAGVAVPERRSSPTPSVP